MKLLNAQVLLATCMCIATLARRGYAQADTNNGKTHALLHECPICTLSLCLQIQAPPSTSMAATSSWRQSSKLHLRRPPTPTIHSLRRTRWCAIRGRCGPVGWCHTCWTVASVSGSKTCNVQEQSKTGTKARILRNLSVLLVASSHNKSFLLLCRSVSSDCNPECYEWIHHPNLYSFCTKNNWIRLCPIFQRQWVRHHLFILVIMVVNWAEHWQYN